MSNVITNPYSYAVSAPSYPDGLGDTLDAVADNMTTTTESSLSSYDASFEFSGGGSGGSINMGNNITSQQAGDMSISGWAYFKASVTSVLWAKDWSSHTSPYYSIQARLNGTLGSNAYVDQVGNNAGSYSGTDMKSTTGTYPLAFNFWYWFCYCQNYTNNKERFYVSDGTSIAEADNSPATKFPTFVSNDWYLGRMGNLSSNKMQGFMQQIVFWDIDISVNGTDLSLLNEIYNSGTGININDLSTLDNIIIYYPMDSADLDGTTVINRAIP